MLHCDEWLGQPDSLVPLCKFQVIKLFISLEIVVFTVNEHENISIAGLNRRAGYATDCDKKIIKK